MQVLRFLLWPLGLIYGIITWIRNKCFDWGILSVHKVKIPVISVGNLSFGGTGKTPHVDYIITFLKERINTAVLLRGYGRTTKGFLQVTEHCTADTVGDEALFYKLRHGKDVIVAVCEKRAAGARQILEQWSKTAILILDDAYQHRYLHRDLDILLIDYNHPYWRDGVAPSGRLREFSFGRKRADIILISKCPVELTLEDKQRWKNRLSLRKGQHVFFSRIVYGNLMSITNHAFQLPEKIVLVTGVAKPEGLVNYLSKIAPVEHVCFRDHHDFTVRDIQEIHELFDTFVEKDKIIVTTAKDAMRLNHPELKQLMIRYPWFYQEITVSIDEENEFNKLIEQLC